MGIVGFLRFYAVTLLGFLLLLLSIGWAFYTNAITLTNWLMVLISVIMMVVGNLWQESGSARESASSILYSFFVLVSVVTVYLIAANHNRAVDMTELKLHTLSPLTVRVVRGLTDPVEVVSFLPLAKHEEMAEFLELYENESLRFSYRIHDPNIDLADAREMDDSVLANDAFILLNRDGDIKRERAAIDPSDPRREEILTNALLSVERGGSKTIYFTRGKEEKEVTPADDSDEARLASYATFTDNIEAQLGPVASVNLQTQNQVPTDCSVLVIASPAIDIRESEKLMIIDYLDEGGALLVFLDPKVHDNNSMPNLEAVMSYAGIDTRNSVIIDNQAESVRNGVSYASSTELHPVTQNASGRLFEFHVARPLIEAEELTPNDVDVISMLNTGGHVWEENARELLLKKIANPPADRSQYFPRSVAMSSMWAIPDGARTNRARVVVYGDSDFMADQFLGPQSLNLGMFTVAWLSGKENQVAIPYRTLPESSFTMTSQRLIVIVGILLALSALLLAGGILYTSTRKRTG